MANYRQVNDVWPDDCPVPTGPEALRGARRLVRLCYQLARQDIANFSGRPRKGQRFVLTTGNRDTWPRRGVWYVNPHRRGWGHSGWPEIVHGISHWAANRFWPKARHVHGPHGGHHAWIELELAKHVIASGWLTGALKRPERLKAPRNRPAERAASVDRRIRAWTSKLRRAQTALKTLQRQKRYYARKEPAPAVPA